MVSGLRSLVFGGSVVFGASLVGGVLVQAAEQTWTGTISDSMCRTKHESGAEGQETTNPDCTRDCVKGGSKYVLIVGEKVFAIANQNHADLAAHAGETVRVRGELSGETITVARVEVP